MRQRRWISSTGQPYGARLRPFLAHLFGEVNFMADFQMIEAGCQHAIFVKVDLAPVESLEKTIILDGEKFDDTCGGCGLVEFDLAAAAPRVVLQLSSRRVKRVADGDVKIFMGRMFAGLMNLGKIFLRLLAAV